MSFAFNPARSLIRPVAFPRILHAIGSAAGLVAQFPVGRAIGVNLGLLGGLLGEMILRAVPKQRTSHSKKRKRMANKGLKDRQDLSPCPGCGRPKRTAHICRNCYGSIKQKLKMLKEQAAESQES
ncbi:hypothetical protein H4R24_001837 [Coemansia sp. RSA 988]|nr:hypothetical protein H4R24_001837 [Coemansia sp. RSA 988]